MGLGEPWFLMYRHSLRPSWTCPWDLCAFFLYKARLPVLWLFLSTTLSGFKNYKTG
jgi:hypothetical protein